MTQAHEDLLRALTDAQSSTLEHIDRPSSAAGELALDRLAKALEHAADALAVLRSIN